ncbi:hypothetical protein AK830_g415 [Neonectria ditissima]|uniref:SGNH hydrolase-type esterase domain-containing protein n=1 Tax=Neonectria ditissima TaxID=78410 RepID=A0A0P7BWW4_9HYPO|nr:hypothetical protein AK830_g415 [Neonectria ditissima]
MGRFMQSLLLTTSVILSLSTTGCAFPTLSHLDDESIFGRGHVFADFGPAAHKRQQEKVPLRILSLGASIMSGVGSSTGDGSRKPLRDALRFDGWEINMVGSLHSGKMKDKDHEAVPGDKINQVCDRLKNSLSYKPNIVIINAGTNDAIQNDDPSGAGNRMNDILNGIWGAEGMGDTCVMLSIILDTTDKTGRVNRLTINNRYRSVVTDRAKEGKCIYLADMDPPGSGGGWITWDDYDPKETTKVHPNDEGHRKMAYVFYKAINEAAKDSKIVGTGDFEASNPVCDKVFGNGIPAGGKTQRGSGEHDGIYLHKAEEKGVILTIESDWDRNQWRFARLFSRNYDDLVGWFELEPGVHAFGVWKNSADGQGKFTRIGDLHPNMYCIPRGLHFIDMNADGLDDIVCVGPEGNLYLSINKGDGNGNNPPSFEFLDKIKENEGYKQDRVRLADIDGDGRGDYGILDDGGNVHFWRKQVDADGAWVSVIESWQSNITAGRAQKHLSNNISNYFNGPQDMFCETFAEEGSGCKDLHLQCSSVNAPAGYFIIHSFENLYAMHDNIWKAVDSAILTNDIGTIAEKFGKIPTKSSGVAVSILVDIALTAWGLVMGPAWNKLIGPKFSDGSTASTVKDTTNDIVKNSMTLTKDILNSRAVLATQKWLFGGTDEGNLQLGNLISDASMFGDNWLLDRKEHATQVKRAINTFLIPLAWAYSPDVIYPFIASSDVACDKDPGWNNNNQYWIEDTAKDSGRYCQNGDMWCGKFDSPPGFSDLVDKTFTDISLENVVVGSINTKEANGGNNGGYKIGIEAPGKKVLETFIDKGIESPGIWNFPICSMEEVVENYYRWFQNDLDDMANFPCNA